MGKPNNHFFLPFEKEGSFAYRREDIAALSPYEKYQLSFHPERPKYRDYLTLFSTVQECLPGEAFGSCLIQTHRAEFKAAGNGIPVMLIGQQSGPSSNYKRLRQVMGDPEGMRRWNHGMPTAASYARAIQAVELANREERALIVLVDTPGADPTEESEADGIAWKIGGTIQALIEARVPTLAVILNRACSGGAIALTGCDLVLAQEYSTYLVITPEAASSILFHSRSHANEAAAASRITSREGYELGIVDELVPETTGPAHRYPREAIAALGRALENWLPALVAIPAEERFKRRVERWKKIGHWETLSEDQVRAIQRHTSRLPQPNREGFVKRHPRCYTPAGVHVYDPVPFDQLVGDNYVCRVCGTRYTRPSAWDYIDLILDQGSFREHAETRTIVDKDILAFPDYAEKLVTTRQETGLATAMITGDGTILGREVVFGATDFGFFGGSFCMSSGEKIWRAAQLAIAKKRPLILQAAGGGARMHEGCSSMVSIPKAHLALTLVERAGLLLITIITDPTLGGVAIGYGSRGTRLFEDKAGNIGFSGKRVIEQYTGHKTSRDFQTTKWLQRHGHVEHIVTPDSIKAEIVGIIKGGG